jgi:hypothetical protein
MADSPNSSAPTLLVMAAGMGSRYGGLKQIDPVGPSGETILEYSVFDALRSGFGRILFLIRKDIESEFREVVGSKYEGKADVDYAFQELHMLPESFSVPPGRTKPWGTTHAILCAEDKLDGPFAAINADDFYGEGAYRALAGHFASGSPDYAMVGFVLRNTLSDHGTVARGVCRMDAEGNLEEIVERTNVARFGDGARFTDEAGAEHLLSGDELVSMNFWGFHPGLFDQLRSIFERFLRDHGQAEKSEHYVPNAVGQLVREGRANVKVLRSSDPWFGVTYKEDRPAVVESISRLVSEGRYPERLWA